MVPPHHEVRRRPPLRPRLARLAGEGKDDAAQLDRQVRRGAPVSRSTATRTFPSRCSRPAPIPVSAPLFLHSRRSTRSSTRSTTPDNVLQVAELRHLTAIETDVRRMADDAAQKRGAPANWEFCDQPLQRPEHPDLRRRVRAFHLRHRRNHGGAGRGRARTSTSRRSTASPSFAPSRRPMTSPAAPGPGRARRSTAAFWTISTSSGAKQAATEWLVGEGAGEPHVQYRLRATG